MKIDELSLSGLAGAARARSKDPSIAAKGKAQLAKAAARDAGSASGQKRKKKKMGDAMLAKWQDQANQIRIEKGAEPTTDEFNDWAQNFMGDRDLGDGFSGDPAKDREVTKYFTQLVDKFYQQSSQKTQQKDKERAAKAKATAAHPLAGKSDQEVLMKAQKKKERKKQGAGYYGDRVKAKGGDAAIKLGFLKSRLKKVTDPAKRNELLKQIAQLDKQVESKANRKNKIVESIGKRVVSQYLKEADARIQHAEDVIFWEGSKGAQRVVKALHSMADKAHQDVTLKWDGSPALVFGRDDSGQFIFTDKGGFMKKGGVGRTTSPAALKKELLGRSGGKSKDDPDRIDFANRMGNLFKIFERAVPKNYKGFFTGDLLYFDTPSVKKNHYVFTPNIVTYSVGTETELGQRIAASKAGIVIHREVDAEGNHAPFTNIDIFEGNDLFVVPSITTVAPIEPDTKLLDKAEAVAKKHGAKIDAMLDEPTLRELQLTDLPKIFYTYMNSKVDTGLDNLGKDFGQWLEGSKLSQKKKANVAEYINQHKAQFDAMWQVVTMIKKAKNNIIEQFDSQGIDVKQSIGKQAGGEGYVLAHPEGDIKLVPRSTFSAANRAVVR